MLETTRRAVAIFPRFSIEALTVIGTVSTFGWLLAHDLVQPIAVYLLEIFLTFGVSDRVGGWTGSTDWISRFNKAFVEYERD